jgi:hypothetical protein
MGQEADGWQSIAKAQKTRKIDPTRCCFGHTLGPTARQVGAAWAASGLPA